VSTVLITGASTGIPRDARSIVLAKALLPDLLFDRVVRRALGV
jgi:hypothetical protein